MGKKLLIPIPVGILMLSLATPVLAEGDGSPPPPIIVITTVNTGKAGPNSVVPGPGGASVTIVNRYYPYYGGQVKTDGWAQGNFNEPAWARFSCESHVYNSAGQHGTYTWSYGQYGGNNCPVTPLAVLSGVVPATYTSWTKAWWAWPNGSSGYGEARQSHYEQ